MSDFVAKDVQVIAYIGDNGSPLDVSRAIADSWFIKCSAVASPSVLSGVIAKESTIVLDGSRLPESINPRINDIRWAAKNNRWTIDVRNTAGTLVRVATLRSLGAAPKHFDRKRNELTVNLGCLFRLKDTRQPPADSQQIQVTSTGGSISGVPPSYTLRVVTINPITVLQWLNNNLTYFGLPAYTPQPGEPQLQEEFYGTATYDGGSSVLEHLGKWVYANTGLYLEINAQEQVKVRGYRYYSNYRNQLGTVVNLPAYTPPYTNPLVTGDERDFDPAKPSETTQEAIAHRLQVVGTPVLVRPYIDPPTSTTTTTGQNYTKTETVRQWTSGSNQIIITEGDETVSGIISGSTTTTRPTRFRTTTEKQYAGGFPSVPNPDPDLPAIPGSGAVLAKEIITEESSPPTSGSSNTSSIGGAGLVLAKRVTKEYRYGRYVQNPQGNSLTSLVVSEIVTTTEKNYSYGQSSASSGNSVGSGGTINKIGPSLIETENWDFIEEGVYRYRKSIVDLEAKDGLNRDGGATTASTVAQPPGTEFAPPLIVQKTEELISTARFKYPPSAPDFNNPRKADFGKYIQTREQCDRRAQELGQLLIGRYLAWTLATPVTDTLLTAIAQGFSCHSFVVYQSNTQSLKYLIDMPILYFDQKTTYFGGEGVELEVLNRTNSTSVPTATPNYSLYGVGSVFQSGGGFLL